jgi:hypothetical protein
MIYEQGVEDSSPSARQGQNASDTGGVYEERVKSKAFEPRGRDTRK